MRYGSICSGIEGASEAWDQLGWEPVFFAEIDKHCNAVLRHHHPDTPNYEDFTTLITSSDEPTVDLLIGGTPCQSFSVAGLRRGLDDDRGNLSLQYIRLIDKLRPRWVIWENVPGVLSIDGGRTFGAVLGALGECGYGTAYRVLDAKHFGVPQRRRRVFVVGHLGDWRPAAAVLFERESLLRDSEEGRAKRQGVARGLEEGPGSPGGSESSGRPRRAGGDGRDGRGHDGPRGGVGAYNFELPNGTSDDGNTPALQARRARDTMVFGETGQGFVQPGISAIRAEGENRPSRPTHVVLENNALTPWDVQDKRIHTPDGVSPTLSGADGGGGRNPAGLLLDTTQGADFQNASLTGSETGTLLSEAQKRGNVGMGVVEVTYFDGGQTADTLTARKADQYMPDKRQFNAVIEHRIDPDSVVGFPSNMSLNGSPGMNESPTICVGSAVGIPSPPAVALVFDTTQITHPANHSNPKPGDPCHPLAAGAHAPAIAISNNGPRARSNPISIEEAPPLKGEAGGNSIPIAFTQNQREEVREQAEAGALSAEGGSHQTTYVCQTRDERGRFCKATQIDGSDQASTLRGFGHGWQGQHNTTNAVFAPPTASSVLASAGHHGHSSPRGDGNDNIVITMNDVAQTLDASYGKGPGVRSGVEREVVAVSFQERSRSDGRNVEAIDEDAYCLLNPGEGSRAQERTIAQVQWASGGGEVENDTAQALRANAEHNYQFVRQQYAVRRLTPVECERLQGFPDGHTAFGNYDGEVLPISDTQRYKMLGNSFAVPVIRWLGRRIAMIDERLNKQ